ncbi:Tripartite motif-containing protein 46 [Liparis tanakae]|uniref:Tripartite motif-containing protein 46 n=1 Tax=Liparis tanakae TaxID=230148 RepID=A0A4Z2FNP7_9TELE|nr:Tripartite motif-containing protein 46 [Liparis tanakae]
MKSLEQELHCSVCKDIVKQPVVLPCQHSVCLMCASEVLVASGYPPPDLPPEPNSPASTPNTRSPRQARRPAPKAEQRPIDRVLRAGPHPTSPSMPRSPGYGTYAGRRRKEGPPIVMMYPCIPCGRDVELGEKGLTDCLRNLTLERIVERYRHTVSLGSVAVMCQFCKPPQALEATKGCADCRANFCNECFKLYHPWGTPRAQHEHIPPTLNFRPKVLTCPEHDQEKLHFYCRSCQRLLCPLCKLRRVHTGHKILPVAHAYQALKEKITKEMNYILTNQETVLAQITQLEGSITQTEVNSVSAREQLAQSIRDLTAALAERHATHTQALEAARKQRGEALAAQVAERRGLMEHTGLMAFTQELLKETDQPCFVQAARQTHNSYDPDSGHDSGAEDALDAAPPFCFLTMGMGKIYLPQHSYHHHSSSHGNGTRDPVTNGTGPSSSAGLTYPLPPRLGLCLDFEKGRVTFYDAHSLRPLWEGHVDCSGPVCPAFCFIGGGALQLQELVANRNADQTPVRRVTIQTRGSN